MLLETICLFFVQSLFGSFGNNRTRGHLFAVSIRKYFISFAIVLCCVTNFFSARSFSRFVRVYSDSGVKVYCLHKKRNNGGNKF